MSLSAAEEALLEEITANSSDQELDQVKQLIEDGKNGIGKASGATDMINLTLSLGINVPRILFPELIAECKFTDKEKEYYTSKVNDILPADVGCSKTKSFVCTKTGETVSGNMVFRECDKDHHIDTEVTNLLSRFTTDVEVAKKYQDEIMKQLQQLIKIGHGTYCHMREACGTIFKAMDSKTPDGFNIDELQYNPNKAEFFLFPEGKRVGIYIDILTVE
jgi:hypothetical protein